MPFFIFDLLSLTPFPADNFAANEAHGVEVRLRSQFRKKPLKQYGALRTQYQHDEIPSIFSIIL